MKILGVSLGTKNGNNDTMCRVALEAAKEKGAEIEFIHLLDWDIQYCSGCVACSRGLVMGKGMICSRQDDFKAFYEKVVEADGVLFVDPIFESGATGLYHSITDRMGPGHDTGMMMMLDGKLKEAGKGWKVVNNEFFSWCKDVIMQDDKVERMKEIGRNLADAAQQIIDEDMQVEGSEKTSLWKGKEGACPHCQGNNFYIYPGTTHCVCELCGLEGTLEIVDGAFKFKYDPATEHHAHDILSGKFLHGQDIFENEGRLMNLYKDPEFKKRKEHYTAVCEPTPAPSKQK